MTGPDVTARQTYTTFEAGYPRAEVAAENVPRDTLPLQLFPTALPQTRHPVLSNGAKIMGTFEVVAYCSGAPAHCGIARQHTGDTLADVDGIRGILGGVRWGRRSWKGGNVAPKAMEGRRRRRLNLDLANRADGTKCNVCQFGETLGMQRRQWSNGMRRREWTE